MAKLLEAERPGHCISAACAPLTDVTLDDRAGGDRRPDRAQRRGQDHGVQSAHRMYICPPRAPITLEGKSIVGKKTYQITRAGIARTFQNIRLFKDISVLDNVKIAMNGDMHYSAAGRDFAAALLLARRKRRQTCGRGSCCGWWIWKILRTPRPKTCPMASSASWRSPGRWQRSPRFCCWMSRPRA